jgi:hypothetical protein
VREGALLGCQSEHEVEMYIDKVKNIRDPSEIINFLKPHTKDVADTQSDQIITPYQELAQVEVPSK